MTDRHAPISRFHCIDGVELHWIEAGAGPPLVILPGLQDSPVTWKEVIAGLAEGYHVYAFDFPGSGLSARPDVSYTLSWHRDLVGKWMHHLGIPHASLIAHSYGGGVALRMLVDGSEAVDRLILIAPGGLGKEVGFWLRLASLPWMVEYLGQPWMRFGTRVLTWHSGRALDPSVRQQLIKLNDAPHTARALARTLRDTVRWRGQTQNFLERVGEVRHYPEITLLWGTKDHVLPISQGLRLCKKMKRCTFVPLPDIGHFPHWQAPQLLLRTLQDHLSRDVTSPASPPQAPSSTSADTPYISPR